jgi:DNA modification methylase
MSKKFKDLKVVYQPIDDLVPDPRNPRTHSRRQRRMIAGSLRKFGFVNPIIVDERNRIIAGHGRWEAAKSEGFSEVPTIRLEHLTPDQRRAYVIADNRLAEQAGWDREMLVSELGALIELDWDLEILGFEAAEVDALFGDLAGDGGDPEDRLSPAGGPRVARRGDLWRLGKHRILCGDAQNPPEYARLMNGRSAAMAFIDPPYNVRVAGHVQGRGRIKHEEFKFASGEMSDSEFRDFLAVCLGQAAASSVEGAVHFVCMDWRHIDILIAVGRQIYGAMLNLVVWNKSNAGQGSFYRSQHELIAVFRVGDASHQNNVELGRHGRNRTNVWSYPGVNSFGAGREDAMAMHPTVKPVGMVADAIRDCTSMRDLIVDPFLGSGTTIMAAEKIGRVAFGIEIDPAYVDVAVRRWQAFVKSEATLEGDGRTFDEVAAERLAADRPSVSVSGATENEAVIDASDQNRRGERQLSQDKKESCDE